MSKRLSRLAAALTLLLLPAVAAGCGGPAEDGAAAGDGSGGKIALVAYSTPKEAYEELIPAFQKTDGGKGVSFTQSYGASGDQSRAVASGLPADVVALSLAPDVDKLVEPGIVDADWADDDDRRLRRPTRSWCSPSARATRKGIKTWEDIVKPGVEVITPNPFTSGGAKWNLMAAYGSQIAQGKSPEEATAVPARRARQHRGPGQVGARGAADVRRRQGRRAALLRERGDHGAERRRRPRLRDPGPDDPDPEPGRGHDRVREPRRRRKAFLDWLRHARGAEDLRVQGLPLGAARTWSTRTRTRRRRSCSRSTSSAAGRRSTTSSSIRRRAPSPTIERDLGVSTAG